jgi:hypothetical protein
MVLNIPFSPLPSSTVALAIAIPYLPEMKARIAPLKAACGGLKCACDNCARFIITPDDADMVDVFSPIFCANKYPIPVMQVVCGDCGCEECECEANAEYDELYDEWLERRLSEDYDW